MSVAPDNVIAAAGWALIHSFWQSVVVFIALQVVRALLGPALPRARYAVGCLAMATVFGLAAATFQTNYAGRPDEVLRPTQAAAPSSTTSAQFAKTAPDGELITGALGRVRYAPLGLPTTGEKVARVITPWLPAIVTVWAFGALVLMLRQVGAAVALPGLRRRSSPCSESDSSRFRDLARRIGLYRSIDFVTTADLRLPATFGWIKPVVLLPVGLATSFAPHEIDAMITHELAHVRRLDALVDALQQIVENLFFFAPGVLLISSVIRHDREVCCDFAAAAACGGAKAYASMLLRAAEATLSPAPTAVGLSFAGGSLLRRVKSLAAKKRATPSSLTASLLTTIVCSACVLLLGASSLKTSQARQERAALVAMPERQFLATLFTLPEPSNRFADAYIAAINGEKDYGRLVDRTLEGCDFDLVWRSFSPLITPTSYPIMSSEYPPGWVFGSWSDHNRLVRSVWKYAKSLQSPVDRHRAARAALMLACMRREQGTVLSLVTIATDRDLPAVSGLDASSAARLRLYWSSTSDAAALFADRLRISPQHSDLYPSLAGNLIDSARRMPSLAFVAGYVASRSVDQSERANWQAELHGDEVFDRAFGISADAANGVAEMPNIVMITRGSASP